jgi:hypothetical protein
MSFAGFRPFAKLLTLSAVLCVPCAIVIAQTESARISGLVTDSSGAVVDSAVILLQNTEQGTSSTVTTNHAGFYVLPGVRPGQYRISVRKNGFRSVDVLGIVVNVQDRIEENFKLQPGSVTESVTVTGGAPLVNTEDGTVSTVVDRNFAENIPLNGRSFQTLIELTPGVVTVAGGGSHGEDSGQFSINGQRPDANYWMVDGVSANAGMDNPTRPANHLSGSTGITSIWGGTNSLVSVDALQEFRIQTSTFAPEFGRTPGGQISIVTKSGTNSFHGAAFDYLRNDVFDSNNWFNGYKNNPPLPKAEERQNDFGGTFGGPILKDRTFFFFSYEGLRLRLPVTSQSTVPDLTARQNASPALQPFLNAYPLPNGPEVNSGGSSFFADQAEFNASYSNPATLDAYSLRVDDKLSNRFTLFGRYNYSPSQTQTRGAQNFFTLSDILEARSTGQQGTIGLSGNLTTNFANEFRFNYSRTDAVDRVFLDTFHGAVPVLAPIPSPYTAATGSFSFFVLFLNDPVVNVSPTARTLQRQWNVVDTVTAQRGRHSLKFGIDYRRLTPVFAPVQYGQSNLFLGVPAAETGDDLESDVNATRGATFLFQNLSLFAQDTWRIRERLNVTYGLRWDTEFTPSSLSGPSLVSVTNFNPQDLSGIQFVTNGKAPFPTSYRNFAPRIGVAYQVSQDPSWGLVARGGFGVFYDLATSEMGNLVLSSYPFNGPTNTQFSVTFPLNSQVSAAPPFAPPTPALPGQINFFDPDLKSPYTLEWNAALEQQLGSQQSLSLTYLGAAGRRLLQATALRNPTPDLFQAQFVNNAATSDYHALQVRFERRLVKSLQVLSSYSWAHSIDTGSAGSIDDLGNVSSGIGNPGNRGPSTFDIRHAFSAGMTYLIPGLSRHALLRAITRGWSSQNILEAHSALPVNVLIPFFQSIGDRAINVRPDLVPGVPLYLYGSQYPGGKAFNAAAFTTPPTVNGCNPQVTPGCDPLRQGTLGRNALRGFGAFQWNFAVHRDFPIHESVSLQFRAEMFNVLNHPNFAPPQNGLGKPGFGLSSQMLNDYLGGGAGFGGFSSIYQIGGPRSIQFGLKLSF